MNILRYGKFWEANNDFRLVNFEEDYNIKVKGIDSICIMLAVHLNLDCKKPGYTIIDFTENYIIVDAEKNIFTIEYRNIFEKNDIRIGLVSTTGKLAVTFDMSEFIEAHERYY